MAASDELIRNIGLCELLCKGTNAQNFRRSVREIECDATAENQGHYAWQTGQ